MGSSRRYLVVAEIEYWREMLQVNRHRLSKQEKAKYNFLLKAAEQKLQAPQPA